MPQVEFRIKEDDKPWDATRPVAVESFGYSEAAEIRRYCQELANAHGREVRWNWKGSHQGHYISPE